MAQPLIRVQVNEEEFNVAFLHPKPKRKRDSRRTVCEIYTITRDPNCPRHVTGEPFTSEQPECSCKRNVVARGVAQCNSVDEFSRESGRRLSLTRALQEAFSNRDARHLFWLNYFHRSEKAAAQMSESFNLSPPSQRLREVSMAAEGGH